MQKAPEAFRTISEVADWLGTPAHVLRFWESKFAQVKPVKRAGGRRYYRPQDMALLGGLKHLLHEKGMTIKGAQALLREQGVKHVAAMSPPLEDGTFPDDGDLIETTAEPAEERVLTGLPPDSLRREFDADGDFGHDGAEDVDAEDSEAFEEDDEAMPGLPFVHRDFEETLPQATPDKGPMLRAAAEALDASAEAPAVAETVPATDPQPLPVPRLGALRAALADPASHDEATLRLAAERLRALRARLSHDRATLG